MERQKMKHRRQLGLRQGMLGIILLCWVLPVVLIVTLGGVYTADSMTRQDRSDMMRSGQSASAITARNLDSMIAASRKASYIATMGNAWASYTKTGDYVAFYNEMQTFLTQQYRYDDKFRNTIVTLVDDPAAPIYTSNTSYTSIRKYQQHVRDEVLVRSEALGTGIGFFAADGSLYMMRNLLDANYRTYGVLVMELNTDTLFDSMRSVIWMTDATVWLGDAEYTVAGSVRDAGELRGNISAGGQGGAPAQGSYAVWGSESVVPGCALEYIVYSDTAAMRAQLRSTALLLAALLAALLPLTGAVIAVLSRKVNRPIVTLSGASPHIEQGEFGIQVDAGRLGSKEFAYLGNSFNAMSDKLKNQFERIYKEELALRDAKIMALQSQINPHFLNNTLEIINWEARLADDVKVCQMLEALSTMLNAAMDRKHRPLIHLSEEMMYVDAYLFIIRERLGKRLTVEKEISPETLDCYVPRLVLQPLLENAVEHGINPVQKGTIIIRAYREQDRLLLEIENDGVTTYDDLMKIQTLLSDEPLPEGTGSASLGIRNVHERVKIIYGQESGLSITITEKGNKLSRMNIKFEQDGQ